MSGAAVLGGTLNVSPSDPFYPAPDAIYTNVIRAASRTGTFAAFNYPSSVIGLQVNYGSTNANIQVVNTLPSVPEIDDQTVNELTLLSFNVNASDGDSPAQALSYSLRSSPSGAAINSSGQLTWTPAEAEGPLITNITVVVADNGNPPLTAIRTFQTTVRPISARRKASPSSSIHCCQSH